MSFLFAILWTMTNYHVQVVHLFAPRYSTGDVRGSPRAAYGLLFRTALLFFVVFVRVLLVYLTPTSVVSVRYLMDNGKLQRSSCTPVRTPLLLLLVRDQTMEFDIVDQHILRMQCFSYDFLASDAFVGGAQCSLLPAFKRGELGTWTYLSEPCRKCSVLKRCCCGSRR